MQPIVKNWCVVLHGTHPWPGKKLPGNQTFLGKDWIASTDVLYLHERACYNVTSNSALPNSTLHSSVYPESRMLSFLPVLTVTVLNAGELCLVATGSRANTNKVQSISTLVPHTRHISDGSALSGDGTLAPGSSASMSKKRILKVGLAGQEEANTSHKQCHRSGLKWIQLHQLQI